MLTFTATNTIEKLIAAIEALPASTERVDEDFAKAVKDLAIARLRKVEQNGAFLSLRADTLPTIKAQQMEIQITGVTILLPS